MPEDTPENVPGEALLPATGTDKPEETELDPDEEPTTTGTLFLTLVFLMLIFGMWVMMYLILIER